MALAITKKKDNKLEYSEILCDPYIKHTTQPICTGSSVVAVKYNGGVAIATDTLVSYGSMAKFKGVQRIEKVSDDVAIASTGEFSDFQELLTEIKALKLEEYQANDNIKYTPKEIGNYIARIQYHRRSQINPYLLHNVVVGFNEQKPYIGVIDQFGTYIEENFTCTGFSKYLCLPLLQNNWREDISENETQKLLEQCFVNLFYRDARSSDTIQIAFVDANGVRILDPYRVQGNWNYKGYRDAASENLFRQ
uniref:Proteasome subunit beta n=1 Tax=Philasterides dicentrarchi TaxID=282688 RepID=A0A411PX34_9CILI|nr:20S proteasome subunit beta 7 [Philasterides dicentrarchi]